MIYFANSDRYELTKLHKVSKLLIHFISVSFWWFSFFIWFFKKNQFLCTSYFHDPILKELYSVTECYVEMNNEYSRTFYTTAGVLQGSATSTILFMAYTADLVKIFSKFPIEHWRHYSQVPYLATYRRLFNFIKL